ncbi:MAG: enhanced serine sensitivity protein SseB C-terminal domain-containing protein [Candidatus Altiarchaeota archaeon]|nr:enhanced serine sensitivity protein SseB C-terminal domain-containing protein [Candidatus Altiarchaeota archaeon]
MDFIKKLFSGKKSDAPYFEKGHMVGPDNSALEQAINDVAKNKNEKTMNALYKEFLNCKFVLLIKNPPKGRIVSAGTEEKPEEIVIEKGAELQFPIIKGKGGKNVLPVFTNNNALISYSKDAPSIVLLSEAVFKMALQMNVDQITINPAGPFGGYLTLNEISLLAEGRVPSYSVPSTTTFQKNTKMRFGEPAKPPSKELVGFLRDVVSSQKEVNAAYILMIQIGDGQPHLALGLDLSDDNAIAAIDSKLAKGISDKLKQGEYLDLLPLNKLGLANSVKENVKPFYVS